MVSVEVRANYRVEQVRIPASEPGMTLAADLYLPDTPAPAVLTQHYGRRVMGRRCYQYFAERGFASVVVDCRGVGGSDGLPRGLLDPREAADGAAVVEWVARQPWCTGKVGMWGFSYGATLALATASRRPRGLGAVFALMAFTEAERDLVHPGGLRGGLGFTAFSCVEQMLNDLLPPVRGADLAARREQWLRKACEFEPWLVDAWRRPPGDTGWGERAIDVGSIAVPAFCVGGWRDLFCAATVRTYQRIGAPKRLLIGPWLHDLPENSALAPVDSLALAEDWFTRWLGDSVPTHRDAVDVYVQGAGEWVRSASWPPPVAELNAKGDKPVRRTDPTVGALSGLGRLPISDFGHPLDQHDDDHRALAFTDEPVTEPVLITGQPTVALDLAPGSTATRCVVKLADVDPDGRSTLICSGIVAAGESSVELDPTCYELAAGHRLRVVVSDGDFPWLWPVEPGLLGGSVTLTVPVGQRSDLGRSALPELPADTSRQAVKFAQRPVWRISRDHNADAVSVELAAEQRRLYTSDGAPIDRREFRAAAEVSRADPAGARLTASGKFRLDTEAGERLVVRTEIEVTTTTGTLTGQVTVDDQPIFTRSWSMPLQPDISKCFEERA